MAYDTRNPLGSTDPRDLYDNASNLDKFANGPQPFYPDRFGNQKLSLSGMQQDFQNAQDGREAQFQQFLTGSGFEAPVSYAAGVTLERATQTFVRDNVQYRIKDPTDLPYTLTGNWSSESGYFASMGDSGLRQDLSGPQGAQILGLGSGSVAAAVPAIFAGFTELRAATRLGVAQVMGVVYTADPSDTTSAEALPMVVVGENGTRWKWNPAPVIDARLFGAVPGTTADNTAAIQRAVDYCLSFTPARSLIISERYRLAGTVMVDNPVDASAGEFYVIGVNGGGFYVDTAMTMFSSRLPYGTFGSLKSPSSEYLHFDKIRFESSNRALNAYVVSDKFLRLTFESCQWRNIKCLASADYIQSWAFIGKNLMRRHQGIFLQATYGYDLSIQDVNFEISGSGFIFTQFVNVIRMSGLYENSDGPFFRGGANTGTFEKLYFEHNGSPDLDITGGATIKISAHFALDSAQATPANDFWPIVLSQYVDGVTVDGCTSNGNLCNNTAAPGFSVSRGTNTAANLEFRSNPNVDENAAAAGTTQAAATLLKKPTTLIMTGTGGVRLPSANTKARYSTLVVQNRTGASITVYPAAGERIVGGGANAGVALASGAVARFVWQNGDAWAQI